MSDTITTYLDLAALPRDTIVLTEQGGFWQKGGSDMWLEPGNAHPAEAWDLILPAQLIYAPGPCCPDAP